MCFFTVRKNVGTAGYKAKLVLMSHRHSFLLQCCRRLSAFGKGVPMRVRTERSS